MTRLLARCVLAAAFALPAAAQPIPAVQPDRDIDEATRFHVIEAALAALQRSYVFPEVATRMAQAVRARQLAGEYRSLSSAGEFARTLTADLQEVSRDKHLRVRYSFEPLPAQEQRLPTPEQGARHLDFLRSVNFGFEKAEVLPGNIGYLDLRVFASGPEAQGAADAAMDALAGADALIVDLRRNGGGDPEMVARISSYLFEEPTHLNSLYWREGDRTEEFWTTKEVAGKRFGQGKPVFVLTSKRTFSGAEEFSYNLKSLGRATIVGETTGGGAHPGGPQRINDHFSVWVPTGRAINPVTKTNWEGTGVVPDVAVPADQALERALELAAKAVQRPSRPQSTSRTPPK
jgi:retinol-binding protein 3